MNRRLFTLILAAAFAAGAAFVPAAHAADQPAPAPPDASPQPDRGGPGSADRPRRPGGFHLLPPRASEKLNFTDDQKQQLADLEAEVKTKLDKILTADQKAQLEQMRPPPPAGGEGPGTAGADRPQRPAPPPAQETADVQKLSPSQPDAPKDNDPSHVAVTFTGGYETDPRDHGRPVVLIAAALNVTSDVFRKAFSNVKPASGGREPEPAQVRLNKQTLMKSLSPYGVTDDRLNEVSNFYRYSAIRGQMWRNTPATAYATVHNGVVTGFTITNPGAGYSSAPKVSVAGMPDLSPTVTLLYGTDFKTNGSIKEITLAGGKAEPAP